MLGNVVKGSTSAARPRMRRLWLKAHRWLGLSFGVVLMVAALSGSVMLAVEPIDELINRDLTFPTDASNVSYGAVLENLEGFTKPNTDVTLRPPRDANESFQAFVRGDWRGTVYLHPSTGEILGRRGETEGFMGFLFALHSNLFAGEVGKAVLTMSVIAYLLMLASGIYLWWPKRWSRALSMRWTTGTHRALFDWHRVTGVLFGFVVLIALGSGAYMAWPPLARSVNLLVNDTHSAPPSISGGPPTARTVEVAVQQAQTLFPTAMVGYVQIPTLPDRPIRVRLRLPDDPHPNGLTSVWLHPDNATPIRSDLWSELDLGTHAYAYIYPLHIGELWGTPWTILVFITGGVLSAYAVTGFLLWVRRRR